MVNLSLSLAAAFVIGMSKAGIKGIGVIFVTLMALAYGAKASTGILVPLLIVGDIMAVYHYNRHVKWKYLKQFLPLMMIGVIVASYTGKYLDEAQFQSWMAYFILFSVLMMLAWEWQDKSKVPKNKLFAYTMGFGAGFTTMIGNLAGAFANVFFLAIRLPKVEFIGTAAWLFFIINWFKLPFHIFSWETINLSSLLIDLKLIPAVIFGFWIGLKLVSKFKEQQYRYFILVMTALGALIMLFR